ncbi:MAG TPA: biopolymer transporter ExbD [Alphaproteobacteria bacterium]|nr:biopolymer transporter ExbD [Alphaproteobacteria bacterium]
MSAFRLAAIPRRRRPSLTPMIDVVFLLLVFFMLTARFGGYQAAPVALGGGAGEWQGPPRLVTVGPDRLALNGEPIALSELSQALRPLLPDAAAPVVVRSEEDATLQRVMQVMDALRENGIATLVLAE